MSTERQRIESLRSRSTNTLLAELARKAERLVDRPSVTVHYLKKPRSSGGREYATYRSEKSGHAIVGSIDSQMLKAFGSALGRKNAVLIGEEVLDSLWKRMKHRVCEEYDVCGKFKPSDPNFYMAIYAIMRRGQHPDLWDLLAIVVALAIRYGPEWMCGCSTR
jgi:hypothetical protein